MLLKKLKQYVAKLVYPDGLCCISCDGELPEPSADGFCKQCRPNRNDTFCMRCGIGIPDSGRQYCNSCLYIGRTEFFFDRARAPFLFADLHVRSVVHQFKYGEKTYLAAYMAKPMLEVIRKEKWEIDAVAYVPIHKKKKRKRGYNQSELLAKQIAETLELPLVCALEKTVYAKKSAARLGKRERAELLAGTFALTGDDVREKRILLVDDVITSRATANECAKMLKLGKAKRVYVIAYAASREID